MQKSKGYLFGESKPQPVGSGTNPAPSGEGKRTEFTAEEINNMSQEEFEKYQQDIFKAQGNNRIS